MSNFPKAVWEHVIEESSDEFVVSQCHDFGCDVAVVVLFKFERDRIVVDIDNALIGNSDAVSVSGGIFQDEVGLRERFFRIADPLFSREFSVELFKFKGFV